MTQLNSNSIKEFLQEALTKDGDFLKEMLKTIMQQLMEEEIHQQLFLFSHKRNNNKRKAIYKHILELIQINNI